MGRKILTKGAWVFAAMGIACASASSLADVITRDIFYTRWLTNNDMEANVKRTVATYDRSAGTFTCTPGVDIARTNGADGIVFAPRQNVSDPDFLLVGGQGTGYIHKVNAATGAVTDVLTNTAASYHITIDPGKQKCWTAGLPGELAEVPLNPFAAGTGHPISGSVDEITQLTFVNGQVFYTSSDEHGGGSFGTFDLTTFVTTEKIGSLEAAHGMQYDPFTGLLVLTGGGQIAQIDPANPSVIVASINVASMFMGPAADAHLDQCAPDGFGLIYAASNDGTFFLIDYSAGSHRVNDPATVVRAVILDSFVDDIAPVINSSQCCDIGTGEYDLQGSQASQIPFPTCGDNFAFQAADDFYLCPGRIYQVKSISATFATNETLLPKGGVQLFEDCDGKPGAEIVFSSLNPDDRPVVTVTPLGVPYDSNLGLVTLTATFPDLWLRGGKSYWVSFYGRGCLGTVWAWTTAGNGTIQGRPAQFRSYTGGNSFGPWASLDECCIGCTDLAFCVDADDCKILLDNGTYQTTGAKSLENPGQPAFAARAADDFVIPPCDPKEICYIEAYIITNCVNARLDLYEGGCELPLSNTAFRTLTPKRYVHTGIFVPFEGQTLEVLCLQFWGDGVILQGGRNYWLSVYGLGNGSANQKALFAYNKNCTDTCLIHFAQGAVRGNIYNSPDWEHISDSPIGVAKDFAFLITIMDPEAPVGNTATPACRADTNRDGHVTIDDIFIYLNAWFAGCP